MFKLKVNGYLFKTYGIIIIYIVSTGKSVGILCLTGDIIIIRTIVSIIIIPRSIVPRSVFTKSSSIKFYKEDKRWLLNSDPWPPAEQKLEMPCDGHFELSPSFIPFKLMEVQIDRIRINHAF